MFENRKILLYVLEGAWNTQDADGSIVVGVSEDKELLIEKLDQIEKNKAVDYLQDGLSEKVEEERWDRMYEVRDEEAGWARFCITEHYLEISESLMEAISREMERINRSRDIKEYILRLHETGGIESWKYEYIKDNAELMKKMLQLFDKMENCDTPYNATLENVVEDMVLKLELEYHL